MPSKNTIKEHVPHSYFHIYNRGVEKRNIFVDEQDYEVFLSYFKVALSPKEMIEKELQKNELDLPGIGRLRRSNLSEEIELLAFCLLPNHFHLFIYQHAADAMQRLMRSVMTGYVMYFNHKYDRVGGLFQGRYKASRIDNDAYLAHISRYIHLNALDVNMTLDTFEYSSYPNYMARREAVWLKPDKILALFTDINEYEKFCKDYTSQKKQIDAIKHQLADH